MYIYIYVVRMCTYASYMCVYTHIHIYIYIYMYILCTCVYMCIKIYAINVCLSVF